MGKTRQDKLFQKRKSRARTEVARKAATRDQAPLVWIVCEGAKTEPNYFKDLKAHLGLPTVQVRGEECGAAPKSVLKYAKERKTECADERDQVWCVIDVEAYGKRSEELSSVLADAKTAGIHVALSNPCFEFWVLLHFDHYGQTFDACKNVISELKNCIKNYKKGERIYGKHLRERTNQAIANSKAILKQHGGVGVTPRIARNPSTEVHELVALLEGMKPKKKRK